MGTSVELPPELKRYAEECVASGRFGSVSEVIQSALRAMQEAEAEAQAFAASLDQAVAEGERIGFVTLEEAASRAYAAIDEVERGRG